MKIAQAGVGTAVLALFLAAEVHAQNVGIGVANPQSKLSLNGTTSSGGLAIGDATYTSTTGTVAPQNGAIIQGTVGIGTTTPLAPLHVGSPTSNNIVNSGTQVYFNYNVQAFQGGPVTDQTQIAAAIFDSTVWCTTSFVSYNGTITPSDARLKNIIGRSDSAKDLKTLEKIEVTDYTMKDVVKYGNKPFKKVIAQQVEKVYPTAVTTTGVKGLTFTPDVYAVSDSIKTEKPGVYTITMPKAHDLQDGDTVRLITSKNPELAVIVHFVNDKTFTVETKEPLGDKVFVYGKQCMDLKAVDYEAISMLNVSATQELAKKVQTLEQENSELQNENKRLTAVEGQDHAKITSLEASNEKLAAMAAKIDVLEKALATMQEKDTGLQKAVLQQ